jgi:translation initiation factor IF-1
MSKEDVLIVDAEVLEVLPAGNFRVKPKDIDLTILCKKSGKMKQKRISVIIGDRVKVEVNPYDMNQGRISFRYNPEEARRIQQGTNESSM